MTLDYDSFEPTVRRRRRRRFPGSTWTFYRLLCGDITRSFQLDVGKVFQPEKPSQASLRQQHRIFLMKPGDKFQIRSFFCLILTRPLEQQDERQQLPFRQNRTRTGSTHVHVNPRDQVVHQKKKKHFAIFLQKLKSTSVK